MATNNPTNSPLDRKNLIIGGNFSTNPWQRGTSTTGVANNTYTADRFKVQYSSTTGVFDILKTTDAPTAAEAGVFSQHCHEVDVTTGDAATGAGEFFITIYPIEGYDFSQIAQQSFTLSFWVKAFRAGTYCVGFVNSGSDRSYVAEYTVDSSATWEKKTITVPASPSAGTWDYTTGVGLYIYFTLTGGANFQTTPGSWQTGNYFSTSNQVNGIETTSDYHRIQLVQIERGDSATPFEIRHEQTELALCQRYYQKSFPQGVAPVQAVGTTSPSVVYRTALAGANSQTVNITYPVVMRLGPTITTYNPINSNAAWYNISRAADSGAAAALSSGASMLTIANAQVAADAAAELISIHYTASAEL